MAKQYGRRVRRLDRAQAKQALLTLANFVEALSDEDPDLDLMPCAEPKREGGRLQLALDSATLVSRFGIGKAPDRPRHH